MGFDTIEINPVTKIFQHFNILSVTELEWRWPRESQRKSTKRRGSKSTIKEKKGGHGHRTQQPNQFY